MFLLKLFSQKSFIIMLDKGPIHAFLAALKMLENLGKVMH